MIKSDRMLTLRFMNNLVSLYQFNAVVESSGLKMITHLCRINDDDNDDMRNSKKKKKKDYEMLSNGWVLMSYSQIRYRSAWRGAQDC